MSTYTHEEELGIVKTAMDLTATIQILEEELDKLRSQFYKAPPAAPQREVLQRKEFAPVYPQPPKYTVSEYVKERPYLMLLLITPLFWGVIFGYFYFKKKATEAFYASEEFMKAKEAEDKRIADLQKEHDEYLLSEQAKLDEKYRKEKEHFDTVTIPEYEAARDTWNAIHDKKIEVLEDELSENESALETLYVESKLVSSTYRELWILQWLYEDMSTSDHDIRYATELFDRERQRNATMDAGRMSAKAIERMDGNMRSGFSMLYNAIEEGNEINSQVLDGVSKTRRDMNIANVVGTVQRHNISKNTNQTK